MSVILKVKAAATLLNTQFSFHVNENSTLQLINGISKYLQNVLKYFNGTTSFGPYFSLSAPFSSVSLIRFDLYLKNEELLFVKLIAPIISSLLNCHKVPEVSE